MPMPWTYSSGCRRDGKTTHTRHDTQWRGGTYSQLALDVTLSLGVYVLCVVGRSMPG